MANAEVLECACGTGLLSAGIAQRCKKLIATGFSKKMPPMLQKNADNSFDCVVAANVIHLLDAPQEALAELTRVCKSGGRIIISTYMNRSKTGKTGLWIKTIDTIGANFKQQFNMDSYRKFFADAGFTNTTCTLIDGRVPCAVAVLEKPKSKVQIH